MWSIDIIKREMEIAVDLEEIRAFLSYCLQQLQEEKIPETINEVSVLLTDDREIHELNLQYRQKDKPTDVLSFSQLEGDALEGVTSLGDIVISLETATKQAKEHECSFKDELRRLLAHGLLHLFGYDHEDVSKEEAEKMLLLEESLLKTC